MLFIIGHEIRLSDKLSKQVDRVLAVLDNLSTLDTSKLDEAVAQNTGATKELEDTVASNKS